MTISKEIVQQLDAILVRYEDASRTDKEMPFGQLKGLLTSAQSAILRYAPVDSPYIANCREALEDEYVSDERRLEWLIGIVDALRHDYAAGALTRVQQLIRAEVFDDFLDMSEYLLELGYKDPAAIIAGAVLEQHLRKLCIRVGLSTAVNGKPKKADAMNSELAAQDVYGKLDQKSITSWLDLRNKAAHGEYSSYGPEQVRLLLQGVRDFVSRVST